MTTAGEIDPKKVSGRIIIIHCLNSSGFIERTDAIVPEDGMNLNRDFYGDKNGTISRKIMAFLEEEIMPIADFIMDLHSVHLWSKWHLVYSSLLGLVMR